MSNPYGWYPSVQRAAWDQGYTAAQDEMTHLRADAEYAQVKQVAAEAERDALKLTYAEGRRAGMLEAAEIACDYDGDGISKSGQYWQLGDAGQTRSDIAAAIRAAAPTLEDKP